MFSIVWDLFYGIRVTWSTGVQLPPGSGSATCTDLFPGHSSLLTLTGRRKMRVVNQCIVLIWGAYFPFFFVVLIVNGFSDFLQGS